jgi:hypothetical protein
MSAPSQDELVDQAAEPTITIRRQWNDWRKATVRLQDLWGFHCDDTSGGVRARSSQMFLHAYIWCTAPMEGEISHSCRHGKPPHEIKVCITKADNTKAEYAAAVAKLELEAQARRKREAKHAASRHGAAP